MLHTKAMATQDTAQWETACSATSKVDSTCRLGTSFREDITNVNIAHGDEGWTFNCYVNHKIEDYWVKLLEANLKSHIPEIANKLAKS
jgi:hypothetical protein